MTSFITRHIDGMLTIPILAVMMAAVLCLSSGCSGDESGLKPVYEYSGTSVSFQFHVDAGKLIPQTRTDICDTGDHTEESASDYIEGMIDLESEGSLQFLIFHIFDKDGAEGSKLVFDSGLESYNGIPFNWDVLPGPQGSYVINAAIPIVENQFEVKPDGKFTRLRIVVFANPNGAKIPELTPYTSTWSDLPVGSSADNPAFVLTNDAGTNKMNDWYPNPENNMFIPMYGWQEYSINNSQLYQSEIYAPVITETPVYLLRTLAKIEIIDHINNRGENGYPKITSVDIPSGTSLKFGYVNFQMNGYMVPKDFEPMVQVKDVTVPAEITRGRPKMEKYSEANPAVEGGEAVNFWRTYCPEQVFSTKTATGGNKAAVPGIRVKVNFSESRSEYYFIGLDGSLNGDGQRFPGINSILRNHIYRIVINSAEIKQGIQFYYEIAGYDEYTSGDIIFGGN